MQDHRARRGGVGGPDEAWRGVFRVIVSDQRQSADVPGLSAGWVTGGNEVDKGNLAVAVDGGSGGGVLKSKRP